jgi:hypothetical protein
MMYRPDGLDDRHYPTMVDLMRWIYLRFGGNPVGGQVLGMLLQ